MSLPVTGRAVFEALYAAPTKTPKAKIGDLQEDEMGGRWRYCYAGAEITNPNLGAGAYAQPVDVGLGATAVGSKTLVCVHATIATHAKDQYANGIIMIGASVANRRVYHIKGNAASSTTTFTLELYHPVRYTIAGGAGGEWATINPSPFSDVRPLSAAGNFMSVVCMPMQPVASGRYFWGKTRGMVWGVANNVLGEEANERAVVFHGGDGSVKPSEDSWFTGQSSEQYAGYVQLRTGGTYAQGDQGFMLQLE